jgi:hypothetical protein
MPGLPSAEHLEVDIVADTLTSTATKVDLLVN